MCSTYCNFCKAHVFNLRSSVTCLYTLNSLFTRHLDPQKWQTNFGWFKMLDAAAKPAVLSPPLKEFPNLPSACICTIPNIHELYRYQIIYFDQCQTKTLLRQHKFIFRTFMCRCWRVTLSTENDLCESQHKSYTYPLKNGKDVYVFIHNP